MRTKSARPRSWPSALRSTLEDKANVLPRRRTKMVQDEHAHSSNETETDDLQILYPTGKTNHTASQEELPPPQRTEPKRER